MTEEKKPATDTTPSQIPASASHSAEDTAINAPQNGETVQPATGALPDFSRLSLGNDDSVRHAGGLGQANERAPPALGGPVGGGLVHLSVYSQGGPVTINVTSGGQPGPTPPQRTLRVVRSPVGVVPPASPARIRLGAHLPTAAGHGIHPAAAVPVQGETAFAAPLSPLLQGLGAPAPASPRLESVPNSPGGTPALAQPGWDDLYEHIAARDDTHTRWYVVTAGRRVGIWREWLDMADYVTRVPGNYHRSFNSRAEAEEHYYGNKALGNVQVILP